MSEQQLTWPRATAPSARAEATGEDVALSSGGRWLRRRERCVQTEAGRWSPSREGDTENGTLEWELVLL